MAQLEDCVCCHTAEAPQLADGEAERMGKSVVGMPLGVGTVPMPCACKQPVHVICLYRWLATGKNIDTVLCPLCARTLAHTDESADAPPLSRIKDVSEILFFENPFTNPHANSPGIRGRIARSNRWLGERLWEPIALWMILGYGLFDQVSPATWGQWAAFCIGVTILTPLMWMYHVCIHVIVVGVATVLLGIVVRWVHNAMDFHANHATYGAIFQRDETAHAAFSGMQFVVEFAFSGHVRGGSAALAAWFCTRAGAPFLASFAVVLASSFVVPLLFIFASMGFAVFSFARAVSRSPTPRIRLTGWDAPPKETTMRSASPSRRRKAGLPVE